LRRFNLPPSWAISQVKLPAARRRQMTASHRGDHKPGKSGSSLPPSRTLKPKLRRSISQAFAALAGRARARMGRRRQPTHWEDTMAALTITKLKPRIGAEFPASTWLSDRCRHQRATVAGARRASGARLPRPVPDPDQYLAATRAFGPTMRQHYSQHHMEGFPDIACLSPQRSARPSAGTPTTPTTKSRRWRRSSMASRSHLPAAPPASPICAPPIARCPSRAAPPRRDAHGQHARRASGSTRSKKIARDTASRHPTDRPHPPGARVEGVFFHIQKVALIEGIEPEDSKLYGRSDRADDPARDRLPAPMDQGDVLVIDDRATMHRAHGDYDRSESRVLWRILVEGDRRY